MPVMTVFTSIHLAGLCVGLALAADSTATDTARDNPVPTESTASPYQDALRAATSTVDRILALQRSVSERSQDASQEAVDSAQKQAEALLGSSRQELSSRFEKLEKAESSVALDAKNGDASALATAKDTLAQMEATNEQIRKMDNLIERFLNDRSRDLEETARKKARDAEEQADRLARTARSQTDNLGRVANDAQMPDISDRLGRLAESASRKVQDAAEQNARKDEDSSRNLAKMFHRTQHEASKARRQACKAAREMISSIEMAKQSKDVSGPIEAMEIDKDWGLNDLLSLPAIAATVGGFISLAAISYRHCQPAEDELERYVLVI